MGCFCLPELSIVLSKIAVWWWRQKPVDNMLSSYSEVNNEPVDESELSDDEFGDEPGFDDLLDRLESNSPSLMKVKIFYSTIVHENNDRLDRLASAIGRDTHVTALMFDGDDNIADPDISESRIKSLFCGITRNLSIKRLHFEDWDGDYLGDEYPLGKYLGCICHILIPLFKNNEVERIRIRYCELSLECIQSFAASLAEFDSLKEFIFGDNVCGDEGVKELLQALSGHSGLRKLDLSNTDIGKLCCTALMDLLSNQNINLRILDLNSNNLGDAEAVVLARGIAGNTTLKELNLGVNSHITPDGWQAFFDSLSSSRCRLEKLFLFGNHLNDDAAQSLSNALNSMTTLKTLNLGAIRSITVVGWRVLFETLKGSNCTLENLDLSCSDVNDAAAHFLARTLDNGTTLKSLNLEGIRSVTITGWRVLFQFLPSPSCALEDIRLSDILLNDIAVTTLANVLTSNRSLRSLDLSRNSRVTGAGWLTFFSTVLVNPSSGLERLHLGLNSIDDHAALALTSALVNNSHLKVLVLSNNDLIITGWMGFSSVLESPNTALEELYLEEIDVLDHNILSSLVNSLANNNKLKELIFDLVEDWKPPLSVFCNSDSIMSTYNSNHTLEKLGQGDEGMPEDVVSLLKINRENSATKAARLKIIRTHFKKGFSTQPFVDFDLTLLPHAVAWMSRDSVEEVNDHFYAFIRSNASLFENAFARGNKRKRSSGDML